MAGIKLTTPQRARLAEALATEMESSRLRSMVETALKAPFDVLAAGATDAEAPSRVLDWVGQQGTDDELIRALMRDGGQGPKTMLFLESLMSGSIPDASPLEALMNHRRPTQSWNTFVYLMLERGRQICHIEVDTRSRGTGFLIDSDKVLTAHHVVEDCIDANTGRPQAGSAEKLICRFDYAAQKNGKEIFKTVDVAVAANWLLAHSPKHPREGDDPELLQPPGADWLDYAVIRLARRVGSEALLDSGGAQRGWIKLPSIPLTLEPRQALMIGQHPAGVALQAAPGLLEGWNASRTRIRYEVNTARGSSGAPCFDTEFDLIAMHNAHYTNSALKALNFEQPLNQGVPADLISAHINKATILTAVDPRAFDPVWRLRDGVPVIGRQPLQEIAWDMRSGTSEQRILVVKGDVARSGRSFSIQILKQLFAGTHELVVDYDLAAIQAKRPEELLGDLARDLKLPGADSPPARPNDRQSARWASTTLFEWFMTAFQQKLSNGAAVSTVWLALDNFDRLQFKDDETREVVLKMMSLPAEESSLRWIVIGAAPDPGVVSPSLVVVDPIVPPAEKDLAAYFVAYAKHRNQPLDQREAASMAQAILPVARLFPGGETIENTLSALNFVVQKIQ